MERFQQTTFGKRGTLTAPVTIPTSTSRPRLLLFAAGAALVFAIAGCFLALSHTSSDNPGPTVQSGNSDALASVFPLSGTWAANDQNCSEAKIKLELDGSRMISISVLGRMPIGDYSVTGNNPLVLKFPSGEKVIWDTTNKNRLMPMSIDSNDSNMLGLMTLRRC